MIKIPISKGKYFAYVSREDAKLVAGLKWWRIAGGRTHYAETMIEGKRVRMHKLILGSGPHQVTDHIDGNGLNNTRDNIRLCTTLQNSRNRHYLSPKNTTGIPGVTHYKDGFMALISIGEAKQLYLGCYKTLEEAAGVRRTAELIYHGEYASGLNPYPPLPWVRTLRPKKAPKPPRVKKEKPPKISRAERRVLKAQAIDEIRSLGWEAFEDEIIL